MTQEEFDTRVAVFVNKHLCRTDRIASFDISKDPYTSDLKTREKFFENVIYSLNGYDLSLALFSEKELSYLFELGMLAGRSCGKCTDWFPRIRYTTAGPIFTPVSYGLLYNWYVTTDMRNICADGWHIPSESELDTLGVYLGGDSVAGGKLKETGFVYWFSPNTGATNEVGFYGRGAGYRHSTSGAFIGINGFMYIISSTAYSVASMRHRVLDQSQIILIGNGMGVNKHMGASLRPIKDFTSLSHGETGSYTDPSGYIYPTICIGTQEWVSRNIKTQHYRNGDPIPEVTNNAAWAALTSGALCAYNNDWNNV